MLTQCPKCETIYRLGAADLGSAQGFVECGECGEQFNAIQRLADEPTLSEAQTAPTPDLNAPTAPQNNPEEHGPSGPAFVLMDSAEATVAVEPANERVEPTAQETSPGLRETVVDEIEQATVLEAPPAAITGAESLFEIVPDATIKEGTDVEIAPAPAPAVDQPIMVDINVAEPPAQTLSESEHAILFTDPSAEFEEEDTEDLDPTDFNDVPAILKDEVAALNRAQPGGLRSVWKLLAVLLLVGLSLQLAWVFRGRIIGAIPAALPYYAATCKRLGCRIETVALADQIELLGREVRDHPQYLDTLLVNATLVSRSETATFFPVIELGLYGNTGEVIGVRRFEPSEYLDKSIDLAGGMPPNRPVYIVLEVAEVGARAVSFEFTFL